MQWNKKKKLNPCKEKLNKINSKKKFQTPIEWHCL